MSTYDFCQSPVAAISHIKPVRLENPLRRRNYIRSEKGKGAGLVTHYAWSEKEPSGILHGLYFGATGGMNIIF